MTVPNTISKSILEDFVKFAPVPIAYFNADNEYVLASNSYKKLCQLPKDIAGMCPDRVLPHFKKIHEHHNAGLCGQYLTNKIANKGLAEELKLPSGAKIYVEWEIRPHVCDGKVIGIFTTIIPVTDYVCSVQDREETIKALSHDLMGGFTQISNLIDVVFSDTPKPEAESSDFVPELFAVLNYMRGLLKSFHAWAETQQEEMEIEPINFRELAQETFRATTRDGEIICQGDNCTNPPRLAGDSVLLSRLLGNLFSNACKFRVPDRPLKVSISLTPKERGLWELIVADNSEGFDSLKYANLVIKPCERLDKTRPGSGMGLAIAQKVAERHGTSLDIYSRPGQGVQVKFHLREWGQVRE